MDNEFNFLLCRFGSRC